MNDIIFPVNLSYPISTKSKYDVGIFYKKYLLQKEYYPYQFDGWYEKKFYGILDKNNIIVYPKINFLKKYTNSKGQEHKNLPFVTDAFLAMKQFLNEPIRKLKNSNLSIYSRIDPIESTTNVHDHYTEFLNEMNKVCTNFLMYDRLKIKNINDFIFYFSNFIKIITKSTIINRSSFIKSKHCPQSVNGLRISIFNGDDELREYFKATNFVQDPEFKKFMELASKFGFYIDRNFPWTMVADVESPAMKKYLDTYKIENTDQIFNDLYHRADLVDIDSLTNVMLAFWNTYAARAVGNNINPREIKCINLFKEVNSYNQLTIDTFTKYFNINMQIRMYLFTRVHEERLNITQNKFEVIYEESCVINKYYSKEKCIEYINTKIREMLDAKNLEQKKLTSPEEVIRMLSSQPNTIPTEGINF